MVCLGPEPGLAKPSGGRSALGSDCTRSQNTAAVDPTTGAMEHATGPDKNKYHHQGRMPERGMRTHSARLDTMDRHRFWIHVHARLAIQ